MGEGSATSCKARGTHVLIECASCFVGFGMCTGTLVKKTDFVTFEPNFLEVTCWEEKLV